ncbi:MAG: ABC transporter permease [Chloroflexota bacterium]|nr:MAG: ABC transporter permease [Chloroflexota bacterium]
MASISSAEPSPSFVRRLSTFLHKHPALVLILLLAVPLLWLGVIYLGSLGALLLQSFFKLDDFTGLVVREFTLDTYRQLFTQANLDIIIRSAVMAATVTIACALLAFPISFYMARYASSTGKVAFYIAVTLPLWSSYLVRVYSWKLILAKEGVIGWIFQALGLEPLLNAILAVPTIGGPSLSVSMYGTFLAFVYVWLPYMIIPTYTALERVPRSMLEASADLGARPQQTFWRVILPLALPGVIAGSIFTFSLTLGDYIIPGVLGNSAFFIGQVVLVQQGTAGNIPLAAAFTVVPMVIMFIYLFIAGRLGAFEAL